jgi:hypothetical protein
MAPISETELDELIELADVRLEKPARQWLRGALRMIPHMVKAKRWKKRPQGQRYKELEALAEAAHVMRVRYKKLDFATKAALYHEVHRGGRPADMLWSLVLEDCTPDPHSKIAAFLEEVEHSANRVVTKGAADWPNERATDEVVKVLIGFAKRHAKIKPAYRAGSRFDRFACRAYEIATGEKANLRRALERALKPDKRTRK